MRQGVWLLAALGALAGTWWWQQGRMLPRHRRLATEHWLNANHAQIQVWGAWQDVQLMPLADHLCRSGQPLFERYCNDPQGAKAP